MLWLSSGRNDHVWSRTGWETSWCHWGHGHQDDKVQRKSFCLSHRDWSITQSKLPADISVYTCVINCIHNFLLSKHFVGFNKLFFSALRIQVTDDWWMGKYSRTALQPALTSIATYLNRGIIKGRGGRGEWALRKRSLRVDKERHRMRAPAHALDVFTASCCLWSPWILLSLSFLMPSPHLTWVSSPLSIALLHSQEQ